MSFIKSGLTQVGHSSRRYLGDFLEFVDRLVQDNEEFIVVLLVLLDPAVLVAPLFQLELADIGVGASEFF